MSEAGIRQHLAAILAADVAGYSRLMAIDERSTIEALDSGRRICSAQIAAHQGRVIDMAGDSVLAVFDTAIGAVTAALDIQNAMNLLAEDVAEDRRLRFRIGVHLGDVMEKADGTIYGEGVNVASRLEGLADPGGVTISGMAHEAVRNRLQAAYEDLGERPVKNIPYPVRAFHVRPDETERKAPPSPPTGARRKSRSPDGKPSVLVVPFESPGNAELCKVLAAAATGEIESALAKLTGLCVVTSIDSADYTVKGRIQDAGGRARVTIHLIDQLATKEFWSEHFDTDVSGAFEAMDSMALRASTAVRYEIHARETELAKRRPPEELSDEELLSEAGHVLLCSRRPQWELSVELIDRVLARSPDNFMALSIRAAGSLVNVNCGWREVSTEDASTCRRLAQRAIELNERSDFAHMIFGTYALYCERDARSAMRQARRCLELNPSYILGLDLLGAALIFSGKAEEGLSHCIKAAETNARFPANAWLMQSVSCGHFTLGRYHDAIEWAQRADEREPGVPRPLLLLASAAWHAGDLGLARKASAQLLECTPEFRLDEMRRWPFQGNDDWERFRRGVAESGLA